MIATSAARAGALNPVKSLARELVFPASPLASFITGAALDVSGGQADHV